MERQCAKFRATTQPKFELSTQSCCRSNPATQGLSTIFMFW